MIIKANILGTHLQINDRNILIITYYTPNGCFYKRINELVSLKEINQAISDLTYFKNRLETSKSK